ncbi:uncharacterized protein LOC144322805 [Canis aureus]
MGQARHPPPPGLGAGARPGSRPDQHGRTSEAPDSRRFGRAAGSPASQLKPPAPWPRAPRPSGPRAPPVRGARPAGPRARLAHLSGCAAFLRRCRRLLPVSAAGSDLWNHHTSPARCCSAAAAPPPPQPPLFVPPSSATASAAPTGHRYALPPSRPPASPSALRPLPPSPPRRRRRLHRRRRLLLRAPLVFIESKQASWRRPRPPASEHPDRRRRSNIPAAHWPPLPGATIRRAAGGPLPKPRPPAPLRAARRWAGPALSGAPLPRAPARSRPLPPRAVFCPAGSLLSPATALRFAVRPLFLVWSRAVHFCVLSSHRFLASFPSFRCPLVGMRGGPRPDFSRRRGLPEEASGPEQPPAARLERAGKN